MRLKISTPTWKIFNESPNELPLFPTCASIGTAVRHTDSIPSQRVTWLATSTRSGRTTVPQVQPPKIICTQSSVCKTKQKIRMYLLQLHCSNTYSVNNHTRTPCNWLHVGDVRFFEVRAFLQKSNLFRVVEPDTFTAVSNTVWLDYFSCASNFSCDKTVCLFAYWTYTQ